MTWTPRSGADDTAVAGLCQLNGQPGVDCGADGAHPRVFARQICGAKELVSGVALGDRGNDSEICRCPGVNRIVGKANENHVRLSLAQAHLCIADPEHHGATQWGLANEADFASAIKTEQLQTVGDGLIGLFVEATDDTGITGTQGAQWHDACIGGSSRSHGPVNNLELNTLEPNILKLGLAREHIRNDSGGHIELLNGRAPSPGFG